MKHTAVEWLYQILHEQNYIYEDMSEYLEQAKEMEAKQNIDTHGSKVKEAKRLLFLGKVSQVIGYDKTAELLKEVEKEIKYGI